MVFMHATYDDAGNGPVNNLMRGAAAQGTVVKGNKVVGERQVSFPALTGTIAANKASVALNTVTTNVPAAAAAPTQAEFNALQTAYNALATEYAKLAGRYRAVDDALRAHGLIG
jgi:hypothetical protein